MKKQCAVIGLGRFGSSVARTLYDMGYEVMAMDIMAEPVVNLANHVTQAVQADATDEKTLDGIDIESFDIVVIAIGQDVQASIMATLITKEHGIKYIVAKAHDELHAKVLSKIGADKIVFPERDMGHRLAHNILSPNILDYIELSPNHSILEFVAAGFMLGKSLVELNIRASYGINVLAIKTNSGEMIITPKADYKINESDILVVMGHKDDLRKFKLKLADNK